MITSRENIIGIMREYKIPMEYSSKALEDLLDKEKISKFENVDKINNRTISLLANSYGCYIREWADDKLVINQIQLKEHNPKVFTSVRVV